MESSKLKSHETSSGHIDNMKKWIELVRRLQKNLTIDKVVQDQINKDIKHCREVFARLVSIVSFLSKNNLAFRGSSEKLYEENNGNFLNLIEMIAEFDFNYERTCSMYPRKENSLSLSKSQNSKWICTHVGRWD